MKFCTDIIVCVDAVCKFPFRFNRTVCVFFARCACERSHDYVPFLTCSPILLESFLARWSCDGLASLYLSRLIWPRCADRLLRRVEHLIGYSQTRLCEHRLISFCRSDAVSLHTQAKFYWSRLWKFKLIRRRWQGNSFRQMYNAFVSIQAKYTKCEMNERPAE